MQNKDKSKFVHQSPKLKDPVDVKFRHELTEKQKQLVEIICDKKTKCVFISGSAGTSKTLIAVMCGLILLNKKQVSDILYIRSIVESADSKIGYLPGDIESKIQPYMEPLLDKMEELLSKADIDKLIKDNKVMAKSISFLRGLSWNAKYIVGDELQNGTVKEITTILTRVGEFSKIILCGDPMQSDINGKSGFDKMMSVFDNQESRDNGVFCFRFDEDDIVRSEFVKFVVKQIKNNSETLKK